MAVVLRVWPWFTPHTFGGVLEYDDGVYYGASRALAHGLMPYRDFVIVHPPLSTVLFLPFAAVGAWFGDHVGMEAARVFVVAVSVVNVVLVYRIARNLAAPAAAPAAGLVAAAVYAVFPGAVAAEHTLLLEPIVNLLVLLGSDCLFARPPLTRRRTVAAGALFAAAIAVKVFAAVYVVVALIAFATTRDWRALRRLGAGCVAGIVVFVGPFLVADPRRFWDDVVLTQLQRPTDGGGSGWSRFADIVGFGPLTPALAVLGVLMLATCVVLFARSAQQLPAIYWLGMCAAFVVAFMTSPSYFTHYADVLAPPLAIATGAGIASLTRWRLASLAAAAATPGLLVSASLIPLVGWTGQAGFAAVDRLTPPGSCLYTDSVSLTIAADRFRAPSRQCRTWIDGRGVNLTLSRHWPASRPFYPDGFLTDAAWQRENLAQLTAADALLIRGTTADVAEWSVQARDYVRTNFRRIWSAGGHAPASLWVRR